MADGSQAIILQYAGKLSAHHRSHGYLCKQGPVTCLFPFVAEFRALVKASSSQNQLKEPMSISYKGPRTKERVGLGGHGRLVFPVTKETVTMHSNDWSQGHTYRLAPLGNSKHEII